MPVRLPRRLSPRRGEQGRTVLTEVESKRIVAAYGIPTVETRVATTEDEAVAAARSHRVPGRPQAPFLHDHPQDRRGRRAARPSGAEAVRSAYRAIESAVGRHAGPDHFQGVSVQPMVALDGYELIVGSSLDPQFGPVLLFGAGGQLVEVIKDRALALPPLNTTLARRMMEQTKILTALRGVRGRRPVDVPALEQLLVRFSHLVVEQRGIKEIDINPLLASPERLLALDARVIVHDQKRRRRDHSSSRHPAVSDPIRHSLDRQGRFTARSSGPFALRTSH